MQPATPQPSNQQTCNLKPAPRNQLGPEKPPHKKNPPKGITSAPSAATKVYNLERTSLTTKYKYYDKFKIISRNF